MTGADIYIAAGRSALVPRPRLSVSEWADRYRVVARGTSPEAQQWRTSRVPYMREIMDSISNPAVERLALVMASQTGKSELILNTIGYYAHQDPSPILFVQATEGGVQSFSKERIEPTFRASPALCDLIKQNLRDKDNTILLKQFPGGYLAMGWSTSAVTLAARPIRVLLGDEVDKWKVSTGADGDPWFQAVQRTRNFHNRKIIAVSTPTDQHSRILRLYEDTDQRHLHVPCLRCGVFQVLEWGGVRYKRNGAIQLDGTHYVCAHCAQEIPERDRPAMLEECAWEADNPGYPHEPGRERRGYQLSALYSPWVRWRALAEEWAKVWADRDKFGQREFVNLQLAEIWVEDDDKVDAEALEKNREDYGAEVPDGVLLLTASADTQDNRLEVEILGWGLGRESWGIHYEVIPGDTSTPGPWAKLDELLQRTWRRADGSGLVVQCACIDAGGHRNDEVSLFCRDRLRRNVFPIHGVAGPGKPIIGKPTLNKLRSPLYPVGVDTAKDALFSRLIIAEPGPNYCHFPRDPARNYDSEYFAGLVSERRKPKIRGGRKVMVWTQYHARNEPLDCRNYATAAMELLLTFTPDLFAQLAARGDAPPPPPRPVQRRRVLSRGVWP